MNSHVIEYLKYKRGYYANACFFAAVVIVNQHIDNIDRESVNRKFKTP